MDTLFNRTKILATIGPSVFTQEKIEQLIEAGINGCRLNFSHGSGEERDEQVKWIRDAAKKYGRNVAILQDLQGPKIRLGILKDNHFDVKAGDEVILDSAIEEHDGSNKLPVQYNLAERMKVGEPLFMFDGKIKSEVIEIVSETAIKVKIMNDGFVMSRKGLNLPETDFGGDVITEKDKADIEFGASRDFDYVAMSFVQCAEDIENVRKLMESHGSTAKLIAKIETKKAIETDEKLEAIVKAADGIMVARGDMAVEAGNEVVPIVQRKLISLCRQYGKIVIVATQTMGSMVDNPEPSRAEVSDVANAVIQGADVVMLSDETANGKWPIETIKQMKKVILYTQNNAEVTPLCAELNKRCKSYDAVGQAAVCLAKEIDADVIVCQTNSGATAASIAAQRPGMSVIAVTADSRVADQLALTYATAAYVRPVSETYGLDLAKELAANGILSKREDRDQLVAVIVSGQPNVKGGTDTIQIRKI